MIAFTTESRGNATLVSLHGFLDSADDPVPLVRHLWSIAGPGPLVVDLTDLTSTNSAARRELLLSLRSSVGHGPTILVHADLMERRELRALSDGLPVVPDAARALNGWISIDPRPAAQQAS